MIFFKQLNDIATYSWKTDSSVNILSKSITLLYTCHITLAPSSSCKILPVTVVPSLKTTHSVRVTGYSVMPFFVTLR